MSFEKDERQLRMDAQDNTESIRYPQIPEDDLTDGVDDNPEGAAETAAPENKIYIAPQSESPGRARTPRASENSLPGGKAAHANAAGRAEDLKIYSGRPAARRRKKALGSKSSFGAPPKRSGHALNSSGTPAELFSASPRPSGAKRARERLGEIEEPAVPFNSQPEPSNSSALKPARPKRGIPDGGSERDIPGGDKRKPARPQQDIPDGGEHAPARPERNIPSGREPEPARSNEDIPDGGSKAARPEKEASDAHAPGPGREPSGNQPFKAPGGAAKHKSGLGSSVKNIISQNGADELKEDFLFADAESEERPFPCLHSSDDAEHTRRSRRVSFPDQENISPEDGALKNTDEAAPGRALEKHAAPAKVLTAIIEKPQILLETPYSVLTKNGPRLRYRLEYDYPDAKIPEEEQSIPGETYSPLELDAMNRSAPVSGAEKPRPAKKRRSLGREIFAWVKVLAAALILALIIRQFVFVLVWVEGSSMEPTLMNQERIIVTRYDYIFGSPQRQDIVICHFPDGEDKDNYVKRIIGLPGERIKIDDGVVYINGEALEEPYVVYEKIQDMEEIVIPEDMYFVMGDNRFNSRDSRVVGLIERPRIQGHVRYVFYPFEDRRSVDYSQEG